MHFDCRSRYFFRPPPFAFGEPASFASGVRRAFTLVELLIVMGVIAVLVALLLPTLSQARQAANTVKCLSNLRQVMSFIACYANDNRGALVPRVWSATLTPTVITLPPMYPLDPSTGLPWKNSAYVSDSVLLGAYTNPTDSAAISGYVENKSPWRCPADNRPNQNPKAYDYYYSSYSLLVSAYPTIPPITPTNGPRKLSSVRSPSLMLGFVDASENRFDPWDTRIDFYGNPPSGGTNWFAGTPGCYYNHAVRHGKFGTNAGFIDGHAATLQNTIDSAGNLNLRRSYAQHDFVLQATDR